MGIKKAFIFLGIVGLSFAFQDSDLDGVDDSRDKCPNTPFYYLVDKYGCPIKKIEFNKKNLGKKRRIRYYYRIGFSHTKDDNYENNSLYTSLSIYIRPFYLTFRTKYYTYITGNKSGWGNSSIYVSYRKYFKNLAVFPAIRITIPTVDKDISTRYISLTPSVLLDYYYGKWDVFLYVSRVLRLGPGKEDYWIFSQGFGYSFGKLYISPSVDFVESPVRDTYDIYGNLYLLYYITKHIYVSVNFSKGLSPEATDRSISAKVGLKF